jgi:HAD superfamily hydrolase (TIGR01509 family)
VTRALVFDCDGVLGNTERDGHLVAFNQAFAEAGIDIEWSVADYAELLEVPGGKERMRRAMFADPAVIEANGFPIDPDAQLSLLAQLHRRKSDIFRDLVEEGRVAPREGAARLAIEVHEAGWKVAVASTAADQSVRAMVRHVFPEDLVPYVSVFAGDIVEHKKPAPDVYELALRELALDAREVCVVEDSKPGLVAAKAAGSGCPTVITVSEFTGDHDFTGAELVVDSLGEPDLPMRVIASRMTDIPGPMVTLDTLKAVIATAEI